LHETENRYLNLKHQHLPEAKYPVLLPSLISVIADKNLLFKDLINKGDRVPHTQTYILATVIKS
jgi:hypothetical protein